MTDHVLRHGVARRVAAQPFDDLDPLADRRPQMAGTLDQVTLVEVVGPHANLDQVVDEFALDVDGVVDAGQQHALVCLLYTSDAADERSSVDLGGRRIIKKKKKEECTWAWSINKNTQNTNGEKIRAKDTTDRTTTETS